MAAPPSTRIFSACSATASSPSPRNPTSTWGNTRLRVALVLDNTGSMSSSNKMTALKTASKNLLTQLKAAAVTDDDVYVSIVPFSKDVNIGSLKLQPIVAALGSVGGRERPMQQFELQSQSSCVSHNKIWTPDNHNTWNGCLTDRDQNFDTTNDAPGAGSHALSGRAIWLVPDRTDGAVERLDCAVGQDRRHAAGRQHQPGDRPADGLAVADRRAVSPFRRWIRTINTSRSSFF